MFHHLHSRGRWLAALAAILFVLSMAPLVAKAGPCDEDCNSQHHSATQKPTEVSQPATAVPVATAVPAATAEPEAQPEVAQPALSLFDGPNDNWTEFGVTTKVTTYFGPLSGASGTVFSGIYDINDRRCFTSLREIPGCRDSTLTPNWWHIPGGWVQFGQAFAEAEATAEAGGDQGGDQGAEGGDQGAEGAAKPSAVPDPNVPSEQDVADLKQKVDDSAADLKKAAEATSAAGQKERDLCADPQTREEKDDCSAARDETQRLAADEKQYQQAWSDAYGKLLDAKRKRKAAGL